MGCRLFLPPVNEVWGKVMFLHLSVSHSALQGVCLWVQVGCLLLGVGVGVSASGLGVSTSPWTHTPRHIHTPLDTHIPDTHSWTYSTEYPHGRTPRHPPLDTHTLDTPHGHPHLLDTHTTGRGGHSRGRYASYWNVFLLSDFLTPKSLCHLRCNVDNISSVAFYYGLLRYMIKIKEEDLQRNGIYRKVQRRSLQKSNRLWKQRLNFERKPRKSMTSAVVIITYIGITCEINYISGEVNSLPSGGPITHDP